MYVYMLEVYLNFILLYLIYKLKIMILFYVFFRYKYRFEILLGIFIFKKKRLVFFWNIDFCYIVLNML